MLGLPPGGGGEYVRVGVISWKNSCGWMEGNANQSRCGAILPSARLSVAPAGSSVHLPGMRRVRPLHRKRRRAQVLRAVEKKDKDLRPRRACCVQVFC